MGQPTTKDQWQPYFLHLVGMVKKELKKKDKVALSFTVMGLFGGEADLLRQHFPGIRFIYVKCDTTKLVDRMFTRNEKLI